MMMRHAIGALGLLALCATTAAFAEVTRHLREFHSFDIQWNRG